MKKTLHGSSDDIGWLQHTPGMVPVEDGSARFLELLQYIRYLSLNGITWYPPRIYCGGYDHFVFVFFASQEW